MKKSHLFIILITTSALFSIFLFSTLAMEPLTFSQWSMNKEETLKKYKDDWDLTEINYTEEKTSNFELGDVVGTITIPRMEIYELPIYYGSNEINNNWQVTTPGHLGNYAVFGEQGVSVVGAHNYQLFKELPNLQVKDKILIETSIDRYVYVVEDTDVYHHEIDDWNSLATRQFSAAALNLMTCYPIDAIKTDDMYIVYTSLQKGTLFIE